MVKFKSFYPPEFNVTSGVPHGSHLPPLLFNVFINDITDHLKDAVCLLYADDLKVYQVISAWPMRMLQSRFSFVGIFPTSSIGLLVNAFEDTLCPR
ncbi:hypothetical protein J437_LFUL008678 [Ladona fulva]|uniref:Reverse transcriptase domain-containing protein n=1 Tax=Ladona fulva TaxID=123851 RepID=A0A8K0K701_LADFU|nr:hypothetical protein J437_LFUL008678 [Ladona fulva]